MCWQIAGHKFPKLTSWRGNSALDEPELLDCFLNFSQVDNPAQYPIKYDYIWEQKQLEHILLGWLDSKSDNEFYKNLDDENIICYSKSGEDHGTQWKIALPQSMIKTTAQWFYDVLGHPGSKWIRLTMESCYYCQICIALLIIIIAMPVNIINCRYDDTVFCLNMI